MHLTHIYIPEYRNLKNVDFNFEKEFFPQIFPLASLNGGGKSTLLQLIFILLYCSGDKEKSSFIANILSGFSYYNDREKILAQFLIEHNGIDHSVDFIVYTDLSAKELTGCKTNEDIKFSLLKRINVINRKKKKLEKEINILEKVDEKLYSFDEIDDKNERNREVRRYIRFNESKVLDILFSKNRFSSQSLTFNSIRKAVDHKISDLSNSLDDIDIELDELSEYCDEIQRWLQDNGYLYITNYTSHDEKKDSGVLLCKIKNIEYENAEYFLKEISRKIYLLGPSTQVYHFISSNIKKLLFKGEILSKYYEILYSIKNDIPNFFTYDFFSTKIFCNFLKKARDDDFVTLNETGEYGKKYKKILNEVEELLVDKKIKISNDFSEINFTTTRKGISLELFPEDLSHGELKRISIYIWLKCMNVHDSIVLMDEIDNALHVDWQYQIISDLKEWTPNNQYILATHSYDLCQAVTPAHVKELEKNFLEGC